MNANNAQPPRTLWQVVEQSAKYVPVNRLVFGVIGLAAGVAILKLITDWRSQVIGIPLMLNFMVLLLVLGWARSAKTRSLGVVTAVIWFFVIATIALMATIFTTFAFGWPQHATEFFYPKSEHQQPLVTPPQKGEIWSVGNGFQLAGQFDGDSQLDWSLVSQCGFGKISWHGKCIPVDAQTLVMIKHDVLERKDFSHAQRKAIVSFIDKIASENRFQDNEVLALVLNGNYRAHEVTDEARNARGRQYLPISMPPMTSQPSRKP